MTNRSMVFLDTCSTTPADPEILGAMAEVSHQAYGNPSSVHAPGRRARVLLERARERMAACLGAEDPNTLVLTGSGTEAVNLAIKGTIMARRGRPTHLVVSAIEHECVLQSARQWADWLEWVELTEVAPDESGRITPESIEAALRPETGLICLMLVNNETGVVQPVAEVSRLARRHGCRVLTDAVQAWGRMAVRLDELDVDFLALSAHKFYGPRGVGMLWVRRGVDLVPQLSGGGQESLRRAGTENVEGAVGMALAMERALENRAGYVEHLRQLERGFLETLEAGEVPFQINGHADDKIPGVLNLSLEGAGQEDLVAGMDLAGYAISAGSACSSGVLEPSHVLQAMGLPPWRVSSAIRISMGRANDPAEVRDSAQALARLYHRLVVSDPQGARET